MKILKNASKGAVAVMLLGSVMCVRSAGAFIWPVADAPQLGAFVDALKTGKEKVENAKKQIEEQLNKVNTVGNNIDAFQAKYVQKYAPLVNYLPPDLRAMSENLISLNNMALTTITANMNLMNNLDYNSTQIADDTINNVNDIIQTDYDKLGDATKEEVEDTDKKGDQNEIREMLTIAKNETLKIFNESFDEIISSNTEEIQKYTDPATEYLEELVNYLQNNRSSMSNEEIEDYMRRIDETQRKIDRIKNNIESIDEEGRAGFNTAVTDAYSEFDIQLQKYYNGEITKEELKKAEDKLKKDIKEAGERVKDKTLENIEKIKDELKEIQEDADSLRKDISESLSKLPDKAQKKKDEIKEKIGEVTGKNKEKNKTEGGGTTAGNSAENSALETSETPQTSSFLENKSIVFKFHSQKEAVYAKSVYANDNAGGKYFIMPKELKECKAGAKIEDKEIKDFDNKQHDIIKKFRKNVVCTKMEKEFWCPSDPESPSCLPYQKAGWKKYEQNGTYKHMEEDYTTEGIVLHNKIKQYVITWGDFEDSDSTVNKLSKQLKEALESSSDARKAYGIQGGLNLEATKLWSMIRRNDALDRASSVIDRFSQERKLYLGVKNTPTGTEEVVQKAIEKEPGTIKLDDGNKKSIFSDVFLYACGIGRDSGSYDNTDAESISVAPEDKYIKEEVDEAEQKVLDCMLKFAEASSRGTIDGCYVVKGNKEAGVRIWRDYKTMIMHDTAFQTLFQASLSSYKSVKDLKKKTENSDKTIISLQQGLKKATTARDDYAANAEIIAYATEQILDVIDADAQSLQTEILQDLSNLNYNVFGREIALKEDNQCGGN